MKKLGVILLFAIAAFVFIGCSDEGTSLRWKNTDDAIADQYYGIQWMNKGEVGLLDQSWNKVPEPGSGKLFTDYKEVNALFGKGFVLDDNGDPIEISLDMSDDDLENAVTNGSSATLVKNTDATLVIQSVTKK